MTFLAFINIDINCDAKVLTLRKYTIVKARLTARRVELMSKYEFIEVAFNNVLEMFIIHAAVLKVPV